MPKGILQQDTHMEAHPLPQMCDTDVECVYCNTTNVVIYFLNHLNLFIDENLIMIKGCACNNNNP